MVGRETASPVQAGSSAVSLNQHGKTMLIQIGPSKENSDIVDLLSECHDRIRAFTGLAGRLASSGSVSDNEIRDAAGQLVRYFSESLPLHVADEEESILPRLRGRSTPLD